MTDDSFHTAVKALRATGHAVEPIGDDLSLWLVDGETLIDGVLIAMALRLGLMTGPERIQLTTTGPRPRISADAGSRST